MEEGGWVWLGGTVTVRDGGGVSVGACVAVKVVSCLIGFSLVAVG